MFLVQPAVLTALARPPPNQVACSRIHLLLDRRFQMEAGFELQDRNEIRHVDEGLVFGSFALAQDSLVCAFCERVDTLLNGLGNLKIGHAACGLGIETSA